jgi:RNA polymerase sigma-70 factor, ECF subfamily
MHDWNDIVAQHGPLVWRTAYRLLGCKSDAADCYQETFMAALAISQRESVKNWPALLYKLATVQALQRLRQRFKDGARQCLHADFDQFVAARTLEPQQIAQERELTAWLQHALTELPEAQAQAFSLVCIGELSYRDAAEQMNVDTNGVAVLLHRARAQLRALLTNRETD